MLDSLTPQVGFEPTALRLTAECSAVELLRSIVPDYLNKRRLWGDIHSVDIIKHEGEALF